MSATLLILGGYGNTGRLIAELLMAETDVSLVLAGRDLARAEQLADTLNTRDGRSRIRGARVDASDRKSLDDLFRTVDLVVVASSTMQYTHLVAGAALDAGVDYMDTQLSSPRKLEALKNLDSEIFRQGRCFITDGGFHPGIPAAMVRYAARLIDHLDTAVVSSCIQIDWKSYDFSPSTTPELVDELRDYEPLVFDQGKWTRSWAQRACDFGAPFGERAVFPMYLDEMVQLPDKLPSLKETGFFVGGFNWFTDTIVMPAGWAAIKAAPHLVGNLVATGLQWSLKKFSRPPYGVVLVLEAKGAAQGTPRTLRMTLSHPDGYYLTAAPVVACLLQVLNGRRPAGLWRQALLVEPEAFFKDLARMGIRVEVT